MRKLIGLFLLTISLSSASSITFVTPTGANAGGGLVSASGQVDITGTLVTVTLKNLFANPTDVAQLLSDFSFTLSSTPTTALNTTTTPTASMIYINEPNTGDPIRPWNLTSSGFTVLLERLGATGAPSELIIGPGPYTNANGSISGNGPHNPFLDQTAVFSFNVAGINSNTTVTGAVFSFGTTLGIGLVPGTVCTTCGGSTIQATPEPISLTLIGAGLVGIGLLKRFRRS